MASMNYNENNQHDQALIPYIGRLQLDQAPFTADSSGEFFYTDPEIKKNLNLLKHLTQSSNLIPVVLSPKDGGKSSLLRAFIEESDSKICTIDANHSNDKSYILREIAKCFGVDPDASEPDLLHLLHKKATALYQNSKYPIIAIENAQHLQDDACRLLLSLQQGLEDKVNTWHVLFFADCISGEPPKLYNIDLSRYPQLHILLLDPYTLEQTKNYISHRLSAAGHIGSFPLTDDAIKYIHLNSKGLPGRINELTHSALLKLSTPNQEAYSGLNPGFQPELRNNYLSLRTLAFGLLILLGTGVVLYFQEDINAIFSMSDHEKDSVAVNTVDINKPETEAGKAGLTTNGISKSTSKDPTHQENDNHSQENSGESADSVIASAPDSSEEIKSVPVPNEDINEPEDNLPANTETKNTALQENSTKQELQASPAINTESTQPSSVSENPSHNNVQDILPVTVHREDWLLKQDGQYAIRLLGTIKEDIIITYLNTIITGREFEHEISYYLMEKDGQYKHTLLYGIFASYSQAKEAIKNLPDNLKSNGPWPVKLDYIKKRIYDFRELKLVNIKTPVLTPAPTPALKPAPNGAPENEESIIVKTNVKTNVKTSYENIAIDNKPQAIHNGAEASLKDQSSDSFTVQLLSTSSKEPLISFMKKYNLEDKSVLYKTTRDGKDWYVLFYGVFQTRKMAESFVKNLPEGALAGGPWIRKMGDLQKGFR